MPADNTELPVKLAGSLRQIGVTLGIYQDLLLPFTFLDRMYIRLKGPLNQL